MKSFVHMNPALRKRYVGLDAKGNPISGLILHVAHYVKHSRQPLDYLVVTDPNGSGRPGHALVPAALIHEHVEGLALCASMEHDNE